MKSVLPAPVRTGMDRLEVADPYLKGAECLLVTMIIIRQKHTVSRS